MPDTECCATCRHAYALEEWDFSGRGYVHTPLGGFVCIGFADKRIAVWMVGMASTEWHCEAYERMVDRDADGT